MEAIVRLRSGKENAMLARFRPRSGSPRRLLVALAVLVAASAGVVGSTASRASTRDLPKACTLLTQEEAEKLADADLDAAQEVTDDFCEWDNPPEGSVAQVQVFIGDGAAKTLELDREKVTPVAGLGDEAYEEEGYIFARKGAVWIEVHLVRLAEWEPFWQPMRDAAAAVLARIPAGASETPETQFPPQIVGAVPKSGGKNPKWPGNQARFGGNLDQLKDVVYQPNVVRIGGGANAIRGVSPDGLTWTIAGNAPGVAKLQVGKIMAATTLALGRVLAIKRVGPNVQVTIGPVALTDVFKKATFEAKGAALKQPLYHKAALPTASAKAMRTPQTVSGPAAGGGTLTTTPICCTFTGVHLGYNSDQGRLSATIEFSIPKPSVDFHIVIDNGLKEASFRINSTAALDYEIAAAELSARGNFNTCDQVVPVSISIPLGGGLALTFTQSFQAVMALAGAASFKARTEYSLSGNLGFSYKKGGTSSADAAVFATKKDILTNTISIGLGSNVMKLKWALRATIGVGLAGFTAGGWYEVQPTLAVVQDATQGSPSQGCVVAGVSIGSDWGVGYTVPSFALSLVNAALEGLGAKPIKPVGGIRLGPKTLWNPKPRSACPPGKTPPPLP
jgi:hypothetical protein